MATDAVIIAKDGERIPCVCSLLMGKSKILDKQIQKWDKSLGNVEIALPNFSAMEINSLLKYFDFPEPCRTYTEGLTFLKLGTELEMIWMSMMGIKVLLTPNIDTDLSKREELKTLMKEKEHSEFLELYQRYVDKRGFPFSMLSLGRCPDGKMGKHERPGIIFQFKIPNASTLTEKGESKTFFWLRLPWRVEAYKKAGSRGNFLGIRLVCGFGYYIGATCELSSGTFEISSEDGKKHRDRHLLPKLFSKTPAWTTKAYERDDTFLELPNFIEWDTLMNPENKYLEDGSITIHVTLHANTPKFFLYNDTELDALNNFARIQNENHLKKR